MGVPAGQVRRLVVIAVSDYGDGNADFTKGISDQVAVVTGWLADPGLGSDRQFALKEPQQTLHSVQQVRQFLACQDLSSAQRGEALVVYITGHGQRGSFSGRHYLRFARTDDGRLPGTALTTSEVISAALGSSAEHVLVLVDSCFAGALAKDVPDVLRDLGTRRKSASLAVVAAGDFDEQPLVGSFTELLKRALDKIDAEESGFAESHLSFSEWRQVLDAVAREDRGLIEAQWVWPPKVSQEPSLCLPNPRYRPPKELGAAVRELPDAAGLFTDYWHDRASGRVHEQDAGWYFSGRRDVMRTLASFVGEGSGVMVITGAAGSGKSALLARLVTLTDPVFLAQPALTRVAVAVAEEERPPIGSVDAAVLARNKTSLALIEDLLRALGVDAGASGTAPLQALLEQLTARARDGRVPTVVIDGLDEAEHTLACLNDVVLPIARLQADGHRPLVRMVLGVRSSPPGPSGTSTHLRDEDADELLQVLYQALAGDDRQQVPVEVHRTDEPTSTNDIAAYVEALLSGSEAGPYAGEAERARATAQEVARAVAPSFLDARLAADQLRTAEQMQDLTASWWQERLRQGTVALLQEDVREVARHHDVPVHLLVRVLRATAFGAGSGLPWAEVWPAVAQALQAPAADPMPVQTYNAVIHTVQTTRLTGYLARSEEDGRLTYRPVHQQVTKALIQEPSWLVDASSTVHSEEGFPSPDREQAYITRALADLVPADPASLAHPYIRRHLVAHAAAGSVLDDEHVPLQLLAQDTSHALRAQLGLPLPEGPAHIGQLTVTAAALIEPYLTEDTDASSRRSSIALHLAALSGDDRPGVDIPAALTPQWGWWESATNVLASVGEHVPALIAVEVSPNRALIAVGTKSGVRIWDASSGQRLTDLRAGSVQNMCLVRGSSGRPFLVTAGGPGVAIWDPLSGLQIASTRMPGASRVQVIADGHQRWRLLVHGRFPGIWSPDHDHVDLLPFDSVEGGASPSGAYAVACGPEGQALLASQDHGTLLLRDLESGGAQARLRIPGRVRKLMGVRREGRADLILAATSERVLAWDPGTGRVQQLGEGPAAHPVQIPDSSGRVALALERKSSVEVWELQDTAWQWAGAVPVGKITALAALPADRGRWRVVTAGEAGVRVWDSVSGAMPRRDGLGSGPVTALTTLPAAFDDAPDGDVWAIGTDRGVEIVDARGRHRYRHLPIRAVRALYATYEGHLAVRTDHGTEVWDPVRDSRLRPAPLQQDERATFRRPVRTPPSCFLDWPPGSAAVATAHPDGLQLTPVGDGQEGFVPIWLSAAPRAIVSVPAPDDRSRWIAFGSRGGVLIWDLASQQAVTELRIRRQHSDTRALTVVQVGDTTLLAAATRERIQTWDTTTWTPQATITAPWTKTLTAIPLSATHHLLASGSGHAVSLWDPTTAELLHTLVTAAPIEAITTLRDNDTLLLGIGGPAGFSALHVNLPLR